MKMTISDQEHEKIIRNIEEGISDSHFDYEITDESDSEEQDVFEENVSETEDNLEVNSDEESDAEPTEVDDNISEVSGPTYTSKSGMQWNSLPFVRSKRQQKNIINVHPGLTNYSKNSNTFLDYFNLFLTEEMKNVICLHTNEEAVRRYQEWNEKHPNNKKEWTVLTNNELDSFLGALIKAGALRCGKESTREIWSTDTSIRRSFFTAALARNRFEELSSFLRFDDKVTRVERKEQDKLAAIRVIWDMFVSNCDKAFEPYEHITVDEQLVSFRGKCPFRQYIKSKPCRYGIKIWAAADVKTSYLSKLQVYLGKLPGGTIEKNQGFRVVKDLVEPYHGSWRGITTDNFFTSVPLAQYLLSKNLTLLGTVRKNKPDTPPQLSLTKRPAESSIFAFTKELAMVSYIPKIHRMVHLLSSQHDSDIICQDSQNKPLMILDYNNTKGGVDNADKLIREYSCKRRTARWPFRLFMNIIDICALNAYILYIEKNPDWKKNNFSRRRIFLLQLGAELARNNMEKRAKYIKHKAYVKSALKDCGIPMVNPTTEVATQSVHSAKKRARCYQCPRNCDRKVNTVCSFCKKFICQVHRKEEKTIVCKNCN